MLPLRNRKNLKAVTIVAVSIGNRSSTVSSTCAERPSCQRLSPIHLALGVAMLHEKIIYNIPEQPLSYCLLKNSVSFARAM